MDFVPPGLDDRLYETLEELIVLQRYLAKSKDNSAKKAIYEEDTRDLLKNIKLLEKDIIGQFASTSQPHRMNERDPDFSLRLEVFGKSQELISTVDILNDRSLSVEDWEKALSKARETCDSLRDRLSRPRATPKFRISPDPDDFVPAEENPPWKPKSDATKEERKQQEEMNMNVDNLE